jgi:hypothetical protein
VGLLLKDSRAAEGIPFGMVGFFINDAKKGIN